MTGPVIQAAVSDFFTVIGGLDAPIGELFRRAFLGHLAGLSPDDVPEAEREHWRGLLRTYLGAEPGDRAAIEAACASMPDWPDDRLGEFMNAVAAFCTVAAPPTKAAG